MALKAVVEKLDEIPEPSRTLYQERDGKFVLDVEPVGDFALEDVAALKKALGTERSRREALQRTVDKYKDIDPEKARDALLKLEELGNIDPHKEADKIVEQRVKAATGQIVEKHMKELEALKGENQSLQASFQSLLIDNAATAALAEAKGSVDLLLPHVQRQTRVRRLEDGRHIVEVIDKDGTVRIGNSKGDPMTISDLVQEMRKSEAFGRAFEGTGNSGSGMQPSKPGGSPLNGIKSRMDFKTERDRAAWIEANGLEAYRSLPVG